MEIWQDKKERLIEQIEAFGPVAGISAPKSAAIH